MPPQAALGSYPHGTLGNRDPLTDALASASRNALILNRSAEIYRLGVESLHSHPTAVALIAGLPASVQADWAAGEWSVYGIEEKFLPRDRHSRDVLFDVLVLLRMLTQASGTGGLLRSEWLSDNELFGAYVALINRCEKRLSQYQAALTTADAA